MSQPMKIKFFDVPGAERARSLAEEIATPGYIPDIFVDDATGSVSIYCAKTMLATKEGVVAARFELNEICVPFAAECDCWIIAGNRRDH